MAGVALVNFAGFRSNVGLNNLAHDIALTIRQAQVFGWSTRTANDENSSEIIQLDTNQNPVRYANGIYFGYDNGVFAKEFTLYTKGIPDAGYEAYDPSLNSFDKVVDTITIQGPIHISDVRSSNTKDSLLLETGSRIPQGPSQIAESFSVAFSRPRPEAIFPQSVPGTDNYIGIYISADSDDALVAQHVITISRFGEIAVQ
jgi:hypothetical protein